MESLNKKQLKKILNLIQKQIGKDNPIQVNELIEKTGLTDREIRKIVQSLINDEGHPIGSTTRNPYGFFLITKEEDFSEAVKNLSNREQKIKERRLKLKDNSESNGVKIKKYKQENNKTIINISKLIFINLSNGNN